MHYTEILEYLKISTGILNYHLSNMEDILTKTSESEYYLTSFGEAALKLMDNVEMTDEVTKYPFHRNIRIIYISVFIIGALIIGGGYLLYINNIFSNREANLVNDKFIQNKVMISHIINDINSSIVDNRIGVLTPKEILGYTINISNNYEDMTYLINSDNEQLLTIKGSIDKLNEFTDGLNGQVVTGIVFSKNINYENTTKYENFCLGKIENDLILLRDGDFIVFSANNYSIDGAKLSEMVSVSRHLEEDVSSANSAFNIGTPIQHP
jgi:hypothetical protein